MTHRPADAIAKWLSATLTAAMVLVATGVVAAPSVVLAREPSLAGDSQYDLLRTTQFGTPLHDWGQSVEVW
jgi:hypothetical protein